MTMAVGSTSVGPLKVRYIPKINVKVGDYLNSGDVVLVLEAMKMETEIRANSSGLITQVLIQEGQAVSVGDTLITFG